MKKNLFDNRRLTLKQFNTVIGVVLAEGIIVSAIIARICSGLRFLKDMSPLVLMLLYLVISFIGTAIAKKSDRPAISLLGFNMVVVPAGVIAAIIIDGTNSYVVEKALLMTIGVILIMIAMAHYKPDFFFKLKRVLVFALLAVIVVQIIMIMFGASWSWVSVIIAGLFSLFVGYDWARAQSSELTSDAAIDSCVDLFIDAWNIFLAFFNLADDN